MPNRMMRIQAAVSLALERRMRAYLWEESLDASNLEVCVDGSTHFETDRRDYTVIVEHKRYPIFKFIVPRITIIMADTQEKFDLAIGALVDQHCDLAAVRAHHRLEAHFPGRISRVTGRRDVEKRCTYFMIHFKNGHQFEVLDSELESEFNIAKGIMVYDLPPL